MPRASGEEREELLRRAKALADEVKAAEAAQAAADEAVRAAHLAMPNVVADGVPAGGEDDSVVLEQVGTVPDYPEPVRTTSSSASCTGRSTPSAAPRSAAPGSTSSPGSARCWSWRWSTWRWRRPSRTG